MKVSNAMDVRVNNARIIVRELEISKEATNAEIAQKHDISVPTVSNIVNLLKNKNILLNAGTRRSSGGRRASDLALNPDLRHFIGISLMKDVAYASLIDLSGKVLYSCQTYQPFDNSDPYWSQIFNLCNKVAAHTESPYSVGIALPGVVDKNKQQLLDAHNLETEKIDLSLLYQHFGDDVNVGDSTKLAGLAQLFGNEQYENSIYVLLSRRIGGVIIHNNELLTVSPFDCHFGSILVSVDSNPQDEQQPPFKTFSDCCSASHIIGILREQGLTNLLYDDFFLELENGNQAFAKLWQEYLYYLSIGLHNIRNAFGLNIVLGGEMAKYIKPYAEQLIKFMQPFDPADHPDRFLHFSNYGEYDEAIGAALSARSIFVKKRIDEAIRYNDAE